MTDTQAVERVQLPSGGWWDIRTVVTRGMRKAFNRAALAMLPADMPLNGMGDAAALKSAVMRDPSRLNVSALEDAWLLHGTAAYSFGDRVALDVIDTLPDTDVQAVLERMGALYNAPSLTPEQSKDFFGAPSKPI